MGDKVQYRLAYKDKRIGGKFGLKWKPARSFWVIKRILRGQYIAEISKPGGVATRAVHFNNLRIAHVKFLRGKSNKKTNYQQLRKKTGGKKN